MRDVGRGSRNGGGGRGYGSGGEGRWLVGVKIRKGWEAWGNKEGEGMGRKEVGIRRKDAGVRESKDDG